MTPKLDQQEILVTNGLGSYSLCAVNGKSFRKYHGLLTIATLPPVNRLHLIGEFAIKKIDDNRDLHTLSSYTFKGDPYPLATEYWECEAEGLTIKRERAFKYGEQYLGLRYTFTVKESMKLALMPLFHVRDHHDTEIVNPEAYGVGYNAESGILKVNHPLATTIVKSEIPFVMAIDTSEPQTYAIETERGYPDTENHLEVGYYAVDLIPEIETVMEFTLAYVKENELVYPTVSEIFESSLQRANHLRKCAKEIPLDFESLIYAADQFIALRSTTNKASILAGYPWFTDWGRDTMISIPGLCLATGRPELALEMIETFLAHAHQGIIPNNFPDQGEAPMYNTVDGTLWLFQAFYAYWQETWDQENLQKLYPVLKEVIGMHQRGTINGIFVDRDGLLSSGDATTQLTWMDVKVNGWVVTPRHGKAVEINALYYNALQIMAKMASHLQETEDEQVYLMHAKQLKEAFHQVFWNDELGYLNDLFIQDDLKAPAIFSMVRPNMLFAISLPFPVLEEAHWSSVVSLCEKELYFDYGLRSLSPKDEEYHGIYEGDLLKRDGAYHRGTGWGWLIGPFLEAHYKTFKDRQWVQEALKKALAHLEEGALGTFAENFDGDSPHLPRGCCAQAWSVAEVLRLARMIYGTNG